MFANSCDVSALQSVTNEDRQIPLSYGGTSLWLRNIRIDLPYVVTTVHDVQTSWRPTQFKFINYLSVWVSTLSDVSSHASLLLHFPCEWIYTQHSVAWSSLTLEILDHYVLYPPISGSVTHTWSALWSSSTMRIVSRSGWLAVWTDQINKETIEIGTFLEGLANIPVPKCQPGLSTVRYHFLNVRLRAIHKLQLGKSVMIFVTMLWIYFHFNFNPLTLWQQYFLLIHLWIVSTASAATSHGPRIDLVLWYDNIS